MGAPDHQGIVSEAAAWLSRQPSIPSPVVSVLRQRFNLSALEACQVLKEAGLPQKGGAQ